MSQPFELKEYCDLNEEVRCGYFVSQQMKKVWNIEMNILVKLLEICNRHNLRVFIESGSLLGAIRHKGFIPWDDDIDVEMFREDYDKLLQIAPNEFEVPFHFQSAYSEKGYYRGHAQVRFDGTAMIIPSEAKFGYDFHQGIFVDIFVIDGVPDTQEEIETIGHEGVMILDYLWNRHYIRKRVDSPHYEHYKHILGEKTKWSDEKLYGYFEDLMRKNSVTGSKYCGQYSFNLPQQTLKRDRHCYDNIIYVPFERIEVPIPARFDELLTEQYGDYMKPVQAPSFHGDVIIDTEKSYQTYIEKLQMPAYKITHRLFRAFVWKILKYLGLRNK